MTTKTKLAIGALRIANWNRKARKIGRKIQRSPEAGERYSEQFRNDWVLKRIEKVSKKLNLEIVAKGWENLPKSPAILAPNHSSAFDPAIIVKALKNPGLATDDLNHQSVFIGKNSVQENKQVKGYADMFSTFYLSRKKPREALQRLEAFAEYAKDNKKYAVVFPEGTRTKDGTIGEFKGGVFKIAKKHYLPIVPVTINNALSITDFSRTKKLRVEVIFGPTIKPISIMTQQTKDIAANVERLVRKNWKKPEGKRSAHESEVV